MVARGTQAPAKARRPAKTSLSSLEECIRCRGIEEAWSIVEEMERQGAPLSRFDVSRILQKSASDGRAPAGGVAAAGCSMDVAERFIQARPEDADEVVFNALLDACHRARDLPRLEAALRLMEELSVQPSHVTLGILVKAYGQAGDKARVMNIWDKMSGQREQANAVTYGCMLDACVRCGCLDKAMEIFDAMKRENKHRNTILYTTLIKGHGMQKNLRAALALFREMRHERVQYSKITYNSIIDVCIRCLDVQAAENLLAEMTAPGSGIEPDIVTYSTLIKGYCQLGDLDKALEVAESMKTFGLKCDEMMYNTLMDGCVRANDLSAGIGLLAEMVRCGVRPSPITHGILVRLYQRGGYTEDAIDAVAQLYRHHGLPPPDILPERRGKRGGGGARRGGTGQRGRTCAATRVAVPGGAPAPDLAWAQQVEAEWTLQQSPHGFQLLPQHLQFPQQWPGLPALAPAQLPAPQHPLLHQQTAPQAAMALQMQESRGLQAPHEQVCSLPAQSPLTLLRQEEQFSAAASQQPGHPKALGMESNSVPNVTHQVSISPASFWPSSGLEAQCTATPSSQLDLPSVLSMEATSVPNVVHRASTNPAPLWPLPGQEAQNTSMTAQHLGLPQALSMQTNSVPNVLYQASTCPTSFVPLPGQEAQYISATAKQLGLQQAMSMETNSVPNVAHQASTCPASVCWLPGEQVQPSALASKQLGMLQALSMDMNSVPELVHQASTSPAPLWEPQFPNLLQQMTQGTVPICPPQPDTDAAGTHGHTMYSLGA